MEYVFLCLTVVLHNISRCIQIRNLRKVYATNRGNCCAVNSLQLTLYENQILALLGIHDWLSLPFYVSSLDH